MSFFSELKRRKVVQVVIAYAVIGWLLIQIADSTTEPLHLPEWADTMVIWLVALGFPLAVILAWVLDFTPKGIAVTAPEESEDPARPLPGPPARAEASIAVLPFVNMSGDADNEYFSEGISEELLNLMARLQSMRVCSRTSSFAIKGKNLDMPTVAAQLGVRYVLEGSVRRVGDRVRITAQLIDAAQDRHLWSENFNRELKDIFAVQDEIAGHIFNALKITLTADERQAIQSTTDNANALDFYLRGRELYHRTESGHLDKSRKCFEEAIRIDPDYALAYAGLTYVFVDTYWYRDKDPAWIESAREASRKAVELAPHLAESHTARGLALQAAEQFEAAEAEYEEAIRINPRLFEPLHFYAQMTRVLGQTERSIALYRRAAQARPEDYQALAVTTSMHEAIGDREGQIQAASETVERATRAVELNPQDSRAFILGATAWDVLGEKERAREWIDKAFAADPQSPGVKYNAACILLKWNETERALDLLEQAVASGARNKRLYEADTDLDPVRDHPRFKALLAKI